MSHCYEPGCGCSQCRSYRQANDYRSTCDCVDCTVVRAETCPQGKGRVDTCDVRGRSSFRDGQSGCKCGCSSRCGCS